MTCRGCKRFDACSKPYYGKDIACNDVEERCKNFKRKKEKWEMRSGYAIKPKIAFENLKDVWFLFPTVAWCPWRCRYLGQAVVEICFLSLHIGIGIWERRDT